MARLRTWTSHQRAPRRLLDPLLHIRDKYSRLYSRLRRLLEPHSALVSIHRRHDAVGVEMKRWANFQFLGVPLRSSMPIISRLAVNVRWWNYTNKSQFVLGLSAAASNSSATPACEVNKLHMFRALTLSAGLRRRTRRDLGISVVMPHQQTMYGSLIAVNDRGFLIRSLQVAATADMPS